MSSNVAWLLADKWRHSLCGWGCVMNQTCKAGLWLPSAKLSHWVRMLRKDHLAIQFLVLPEPSEEFLFHCSLLPQSCWHHWALCFTPSGSLANNLGVGGHFVSIVLDSVQVFFFFFFISLFVLPYLLSAILFQGLAKGWSWGRVWIHLCLGQTWSQSFNVIVFGIVRTVSGENLQSSSWYKNTLCLPLYLEIINYNLSLIIPCWLPLVDRKLEEQLKLKVLTGIIKNYRSHARLPDLYRSCVQTYLCWREQVDKSTGMTDPHLWSINMPLHTAFVSSHTNHFYFILLVLCFYFQQKLMTAWTDFLKNAPSHTFLFSNVCWINEIY